MVRARSFVGAIRLPRGNQIVAREFYLVSHGQYVRRFDVSVSQSVGVQITKGVQGGCEDVTYFCGGERTVGENLRDGFVGEFHHGVEQIQISQFTAPGPENANQVRMGELGSGFPTRELHLSPRGVRKNELDSSF